MPISALPQSTARLLGSSLVIVTPESVIKELIDNAIDGGASSVSVIVTPDTISEIFVRDDGCGIPKEDFEALGKRAHTSKLNDLKELRNKGGSTLGFRGDALASINAFGTVSITTKTAQDHAGSLLHLRPKEGGFLSQKPVPACNGTTVVVNKIFENFPVRKQSALRNAPKTLKKIKELLEIYAITVPLLKLSYKVLRTDNLPWSYAPRLPATTREAVLQVLGSEVTSQCFQKEITDDEAMKHSRASTPSEQDEHQKHYSLQAFLPRPEADPSKISNKRCFLTVDSRPVSPIRGTMKKLVSIFKDHLGKALTPGESHRSLVNPFLQLNIMCPPGSYDVNVSPAKDEVLFSDEKKILSLFEDMCLEAYGRGANQQPTLSPDPFESSAIGSEAFNSAARPGINYSRHATCGRTIESRDPSLESSRISLVPSWNNAETQEIYARTKFKVDMCRSRTDSTDNDEEPIIVQLDNDPSEGGHCFISPGDVLPIQECEDQARQQAFKDLNPWTIAKITSSSAQLPVGREVLMLDPDDMSLSDLELPILRPYGLPGGDPEGPPPLPRLEPRDERQAISCPSTCGHVGVSRHLAAKYQVEVPHMQNRSPSTASLDIGFGFQTPPPSSDPPRQPRKGPSAPFKASTRANPNKQVRQSQTNLAEKRSQAQPDCHTEIQLLFGGKRAEARNTTNRVLHDEADDFMEQLDGNRVNARDERGQEHPRNRPRDQPAEAFVPLSIGEGRGAIDQAGVGPGQDALFNRTEAKQNVDRRVAQESFQGCWQARSSSSRPPPLHHVDEVDPRRLLIRMQRYFAEYSTKKKRFTRLKINQLPLEVVPTRYRIHDIVQRVEVDSEALEPLIEEMAETDSYVSYGLIDSGFSGNLGEASFLEGRLRTLLHDWTKVCGTPEDMHVDL
jgi:DNA mismatch repair protein MutL